jgi:peptidoglycan/LPS O-acetylase OafA/YrhL
MASQPRPAAVPDAVAPPPRHRRFPLLDGMRALAVLSIVIVHVAFFAAPGSVPLPRALLHLNLGVTIFFLTSGFLLYRPFIAHRTGGAPAPPIPQYAKRRALRILPAYWLALTVLTLIPGTTGVSGGDWLTQYSLIQTLPVTDAANSCVGNLDCGLAQTWSLVVELSFYALLPLWFVLSERLARGRPLRRWVTLEISGLAALSAVSMVLHFVVSDGGVRSVIGGTTIGYVLWFALGMTLAILSVAIEGRPAPRWADLLARHPLVPWTVAIVLYVVLCATLPVTPFLFLSGQQLWAHVAFGAIAMLLMLPAVIGDGSGGAPRRLLANPVVAWLGLISYGIFLWHYVVTVEFGSHGDGLAFWPLLAVTLAISVAAATLSYYVLERPILKFKYRTSR